MAGTPLALTATVRPGFANNSGIVWLVADAGTTGASINGNILNADSGGTALIIAKIANGKGKSKDFTHKFQIVFASLRVITGIEIKTQPNELNYVHGDALNLSGLVVTISYKEDDESTTEDVEYFQFASYGITAVPAHGSALSLSTHNDTAVLIMAGDYSAATDNLTITKAAGAAVGIPSVSWDFASKTITVSAVTAPANGQSVEYAFSMSDAANPSDLAWAVGKLTFTNADDGIANDTTYYIYARSASNENYSTGAASISEGITTSSTTVSVSGVTLNKTSATLAVGATETLTATVAPSNATNKTVTWESSDIAVATVSGGMVTAVSAGTADITVKTADGDFTAACTVTVFISEARITSTGAEYATLTAAITAAENGTLANPTEILLLKDITANEGYIIPANKNIKLIVATGQTRIISANAGNFALFTINTGTTLTLGDTVGTLTLDGKKATAQNDRRGVNVSGGTLTMNNNITITGFGNSYNSTTVGGGGVYVNGGTFTMEGGSINGNNGIWGGGVYVSTAGELTMKGGDITNNTANSNGGGVLVYEAGKFTMEGGDIKNNTSTGSNGGGVYTSGTFTMEGGSIDGNTAFNGGGVYGREFTIKDGYIKNNTASTYGGGGVNVTTFTMEGGSIESNTSASYGGGVNAGTFTMKGGIIKNNTSESATSGGGGVYTSGTFTMEGGDIMNNTAHYIGGGIYLSGTATFTMSGGTVYGADDPSKQNNATYGKSIYVAGTAQYGGGYGAGTIITTNNTLPVIKATGAAVTQPTVSGTTQNSITVNTVTAPANGQTVEYAILTVNNGNPTSWQSGTTFSGLSSGTTYYVYARSASNANYNAGTASVSAGIATAPTDPQARITSTGVEYATLTAAMTAAANGTLAAPTEIVILRNITVSSGYTIPGNKNIKLTVLAGQDITITAAAGNYRLFSVSNASSSLTLGQTAGGGTLTLSGNNEAAAENRQSVYISGSGRTFVLNDGVTITGFKNSGTTLSGGGCVYVSGGTFTMNGGAISGNTNSHILSGGGGVSIISGTFTMSGGSISGNTTTNPGGGGGVHIGSGTFTMSGGEISGNTASSNGGGGVYVYGTFTMNGGEISGNTASSNGGGVHVGADGTFTMNGGEIAGNSVTGTGTIGRGGGVYVDGFSAYPSTFTMSGGTIYGTDNTAKTNTANGSAPKGVAVYLGTDGTAKYGDGDDIVSGAPNGVDTTVTGHN
jgi:parallel beta-helix repeat protein